MEWPMSGAGVFMPPGTDGSSNISIGNDLFLGSAGSNAGFFASESNRGNGQPLHHQSTSEDTSFAEPSSSQSHEAVEAATVLSCYDSELESESDRSHHDDVEISRTSNGHGLNKSRNDMFQSSAATTLPFGEFDMPPAFRRTDYIGLNTKANQDILNHAGSSSLAANAMGSSFPTYNLPDHLRASTESVTHPTLMQSGQPVPVE